MTTPYPAQDPKQPQDPYSAPESYGAQQQYGGAQQPYAGQQQYGAPQPYGGQPYGAPASTKRPGVLTAAAVIAFVVGGFSILGGIALLGLSSIGFIASFLVISGIVALVLSGLLIWGGVTALSGKNSRILVSACGLVILWNIISAILLSAQLDTYTVSATDFVRIILPVLIIVFCLNPQSKDWVRSRGGSTF
ncbi:MAG: hypothetical protein WKF57_02030 [Nakamurella sp.]